MVRARRERNRAILQLRRRGVRPSEIAAQHNVTCGRITQIVAANSAVEERRAALEKKYGERPDIAGLGDDAPLDVLMLCASDTHGWPARVLSLCRGRKPLKTLGDLRRLTDVELLSMPGVGAALFAELRALCRRARAPKKAVKPAKAAQPIKEAIEGW